jgi:hypothetical protein
MRCFDGMTKLYVIYMIVQLDHFDDNAQWFIAGITDQTPMMMSLSWIVQMVEYPSLCIDFFSYILYVCIPSLYIYTYTHYSMYICCIGGLLKLVC